MIFVSRIVGESYDLETGKEMPKALALSNGREEFLLFVEDSVVQSIIRLAQSIKPEKKVLNLREEVSVSDETNVRLNPSMMTPTEPPDEPVMEDGPGADYDDPTTGVASL